MFSMDVKKFLTLTALCVLLFDEGHCGWGWGIKSSKPTVKPASVSRSKGLLQTQYSAKKNPAPPPKSGGFSYGKYLPGNSKQKPTAKPVKTVYSSKKNTTQPPKTVSLKKQVASNSNRKQPVKSVGTGYPQNPSKNPTKNTTPSPKSVSLKKKVPSSNTKQKQTVKPIGRSTSTLKTQDPAGKNPSSSFKLTHSAKSDSSKKKPTVKPARPSTLKGLPNASHAVPSRQTSVKSDQNQTAKPPKVGYRSGFLSSLPSLEQINSKIGSVKQTVDSVGQTVDSARQTYDSAKQTVDSIKTSLPSGLTNSFRSSPAKSGSVGSVQRTFGSVQQAIGSVQQTVDSGRQTVESIKSLPMGLMNSFTSQPKPNPELVEQTYEPAELSPPNPRQTRPNQKQTVTRQWRDSRTGQRSSTGVKWASLYIRFDVHPSAPINGRPFTFPSPFSFQLGKTWTSEVMH